MFNCECEVCGYTVRTARKRLEAVGGPLCSVDGHGRMQHDPLDTKDDESD